MNGYTKIGINGHYGQLVFVRTIRNIVFDDGMNTETLEYDKKLRGGFILSISNHFKGYYLVKFFTGEREYHWGTDLFKKNQEINLTHLKKKLIINK